MSWTDSPVAATDPRSEPVLGPAPVPVLGSNSHTVVVQHDDTNIPRAAGRGSEGRDQSVTRLFGPCREHGRPPGSAGTDQIPVDFGIGSNAVVRQSAP